MMKEKSLTASQNAENLDQKNEGSELGCVFCICGWINGRSLGHTSLPKLCKANEHNANAILNVAKSADHPG